MNIMIFYILSFTWGLPITLAGSLAVLFLILTGNKPKGKYGYCVRFEVGDTWGGLNLGPFIITCKNFDDSLLNHEHGHAIQNCWFGLLMPFIITIPSAIRYWYREVKFYKKGLRPITAYDSIWFEGQATRVGTKFMNRHDTVEKD